MAEDEPRWFYVGNGQLRLKEGEDWTEQYQAIESARTTQTAAATEAGLQKSLETTSTRGPARKWLLACAGLVVVGAGAAYATGSLSTDRLTPLLSASPAVTTAAQSKASIDPRPDWNGGGFTKADFAKRVGEVPVLVGDVRSDSRDTMLMRVDLMSLGFQFDTIGRLPAPPRVDPTWWAATNARMSQLSKQAAAKLADGDEKAAMASLEAVVKSSNTMITKVNAAFKIHIPLSRAKA